MIQIVPLNGADLLAYVTATEFRTQAVLPISLHRAQAQMCNPNLRPDDIILFLAYNDAELVGYLGVLPDNLRLADGSMAHCGAMTCLWVAPAQRGKRIAQQLLAACFAVWKNRIIATEFTKVAKKLYDKTQLFSDMQLQTGIRLYFRADAAHLLPPKHWLLAQAKPLLKVLDNCANTILDLRFLLLKAKKTPKNFVYVNTVDAEIENFILATTDKNLFPRNAEFLNWLLHNTWVLAAPQGDAQSAKYHFSAIVHSFEFCAIKLYDDAHDLVAFLIFAKRDYHLKIPYLYYKTAALPAVTALIWQHSKAWRVNMLTIFQPELVAYLQTQKSHALWQQPALRHYICSTEWANLGLLPDFTLQDGDADCAFT
jgi:GNAT superfamily N-acetyltransferase